MGAMKAGLRYVRHDPALQAVLVRTGVYVSCASALWAMMPLVARKQLGLGAGAYGILLGGLGAGAILAAFILPAIRRRVSVNALVIAGTVVFAGATAALATVRIFPLLCLAMIFGGIAWMTLMSSFNVIVQTIVPSWVRARAGYLHAGLLWRHGVGERGLGRNRNPHRRLRDFALRGGRFDSRTGRGLFLSVAGWRGA